MAENRPKWKEAKEERKLQKLCGVFTLLNRGTIRPTSLTRPNLKFLTRGEFEHDVWVGKFRGEYGALEPEGMNFSGVKRDKVKDGVEELLKWLNLCDATNLPTQRFAAQAFLSFIHLHPFGDGNGRTGQLLYFAANHNTRLDVWVGKFRGEYGALEPEGMNFSGVKREKVNDGVVEFVKWMNLSHPTFIIKEDCRKKINTVLQEKDDENFINFLEVGEAMCVRMCSNPSTYK
ncbi:hypothetical protein niasHT_031361 [Heterodera trifolii]|uniref:Fido domain-containing protein n=1 Tax=Heterodera trifolii TaxID=157864 RepID=A0ABD2IZB2_9BILA